MKYVIIFMILILVLIPLTVEKKRRRMFTIADAENAIKAVQTKFGTERAKLIEKILRLETGHFTSKQYQLTGTAGMEAGKWGKAIKKYFPNGYKTISMDDTKKPGLEKFIVWDSVKDFAFFLSEYIDRYGGDYSRWNSTDNQQKINYISKVNSITPKFV